MNVYHRKLYALLHNPDMPEQASKMLHKLQCLQGHCDDLRDWWKQSGHLSAEIGSSSDRVNLEAKEEDDELPVLIKHPISGQSQSVSASNQLEAVDISQVIEEQDVEKVFWWFWRFYPDRASKHPDALLFPAHKILPDCPLHSYRSTVSALTGAMFPAGWESGTHEHPYLFLFTFSPVQEFIKSSRKFLDFWAGSYLLHYLSVKLCWQIATEYGPDAVITPSLWSQEIFDALMVQKYPEFSKDFALHEGDPVSRFENKQSSSLSTAGFPNAIAVLVPGKDAGTLGEKLAEKLKAEWAEIARNVRQHVKGQVIQHLSDGGREKLWKMIAAELPTDADPNPYRRDLEKWQQHGCWEWNKLWDAQINNTWESYWTAVPIGNPDREMMIHKDSQGKFDDTWIRDQETSAPSRSEKPIPTAAEEEIYKTLNVGTWWGNAQSLLGQLIQSVKNTRSWQIPAAPGERSTLSGQFSAVHPNLLYNEQFREGGGLPSGSMRLFWRVMAEVYPGLFNGSEKLNAIELTKRMAWVYGDVAKSLGIEVHTSEGQMDYEGFIRFPNLSSIAAARFAHDHPERVQQYWENLSRSLHHSSKKSDATVFTREQINAFHAKTRRPLHVPKTDQAIAQKLNNGNGYNGVMFSSKWLADDIGLNTQVEGRPTKQVEELRGLVETAHKQSGFGDGSPSDWWVMVLADGDDMGKYVSGKKLKLYRDYIMAERVTETTHQAELDDFLNKVKKRMGPATHVGLNRALLDFSNCLVPYITEQRSCGRVVYSGGDDVMAVLPLADLPGFLLSLQSAWCGGRDPLQKFDNKGGYWHPVDVPELPDRPFFTMGEGATMSMGIIIAYKSVPLPTVLENLWVAEKERAKKLPQKDGLCFRVIYGSGNTLEALMKGHLLDSWWKFIQQYKQTDLSPVLYRLAEELPQHASVTESDRLFHQAARVILGRREQSLSPPIEQYLLDWLDQWEDWAYKAQTGAGEDALGTQVKDLAMLLRFSAFWVDKMVQQSGWVKEGS